MVNSKSLFLGVYASNNLIRTLFLPICSAILCAPFALLFLRYFKVDQNVIALIPGTIRTMEFWFQAVIGAVWVALVSRFLSGRSGGGNEKDGGKRTVQQLPYWIPSLRNWGSVVLGGEGWFKGIRESSLTNIFAYNSAGAKHNVVLSASMLDRIVGNTNSLEEADLTALFVSQNAFGLPKNAKEQYLQMRPSILKLLQKEIFKGEQLQNIVSASVQTLSQSLPDLTTFNTSIVDQLPWERVAEVDLTDGTDESEFNLFALLNEFFCSAIIPHLTGLEFPESHELLASDLATLNENFYALALGFPRWFPVPGLPSAQLVRKRLLGNFTELFNNLANPPQKNVPQDDESMSGEEDTDADTPTPMTALNNLLSKHDVPIPMRAAIALQVIHHITSQAVPLAFWTLMHIYSLSVKPTDQQQTKEPSPVDRIRAETKNWVEAVQPPSIHLLFTSPPEISFRSTSELFNPSASTYLRSCIFEARRLYTASVKTAKITKPITITDVSTVGAEEEWELEAGSYLDIGLSQTLINTSTTHYLSPTTYNPARFPHVQSPSPLASSTFNDSEELITALVMALVTGITQLWDIAGAPKKSLWRTLQEAQAMAAGEKMVKEEGVKRVGVWQIPQAIDGASVKVPKGDVRVRVRRREGLDAKGRTMQKGK